jgi:hypothetical protein
LRRFSEEHTRKELNDPQLKRRGGIFAITPIPPLNLQEEFAGVVARVEALRGRMAEAERQVEGLFEGMLKEAFGG